MIRKHTRPLFAIISLCISAYIFSGCSKEKSGPAANATGINKVGHVIVIYMENHSFDNLYGEFPGANGLANAKPIEYIQIDTMTGKPYENLPWSDSNHIVPSPAFANKPFPIDSLLPESIETRDLIHAFYHEQSQIDGGKMDRFAQISDARGLVMGFYHTAKLPMFPIVSNYTLCDNFFHSAFGGSFLNHIFMIAAAPPVCKDAPDSIKTKGIISPNGAIDKGAKGLVAFDFDGVNTIQSINSPHRNRTYLAPNQTMPNIGDRLSDNDISWAWYSGKWNTILSGNAKKSDSDLFQFHHQPFIYFEKYADGKPAKAEHLKDEEDFFKSLKDGTTPAVSFIKPFGIDNEHPGYTDLLTGEKHLVKLIDSIKASPVWNDCVVIITYDEHGGFWDHVAPPKIDQWGPGLRVPGIIISPFSVKGVDHTQYETLSILAFIEKRWGLKPLNSRDSLANPFTNALKF
jgi:phospholipase C